MYIGLVPNGMSAVVAELAVKVNPFTALGAVCIVAVDEVLFNFEFLPF